MDPHPPISPSPHPPIPLLPQGELLMSNINNSSEASRFTDDYLRLIGAVLSRTEQFIKGSRKFVKNRLSEIGQYLNYLNELKVDKVLDKSIQWKDEQNINARSDEIDKAIEIFVDNRKIYTSLIDLNSNLKNIDPLCVEKLQNALEAPEKLSGTVEIRVVKTTVFSAENGRVYKDALGLTNSLFLARQNNQQQPLTDLMATVVAQGQTIEQLNQKVERLQNQINLNSSNVQSRPLSGLFNQIKTAISTTWAGVKGKYQQFQAHRVINEAPSIYERLEKIAKLSEDNSDANNLGLITLNSDGSITIRSQPNQTPSNCPASGRDLVNETLRSVVNNPSTFDPAPTNRERQQSEPIGSQIELTKSVTEERPQQLLNRATALVQKLGSEQDNGDLLLSGGNFSLAYSPQTGQTNIFNQQTNQPLFEGNKLASIATVADLNKLDAVITPIEKDLPKIIADRDRGLFNRLKKIMSSPNVGQVKGPGLIEFLGITYHISLAPGNEEGKKGKISVIDKTKGVCIFADQKLTPQATRGDLDKLNHFLALTEARLQELSPKRGRNLNQSISNKPASGPRLS